MREVITLNTNVKTIGVQQHSGMTALLVQIWQQELKSGKGNIYIIDPKGDYVLESKGGG